MSFFRQYIVPFLMLAMFAVALLAVSSRAFLDSDMAAPAPITADDLGFTYPAIAPSNLLLNSFLR